MVNKRNHPNMALFQVSELLRIIVICPVIMSNQSNPKLLLSAEVKTRILAPPAFHARVPLETETDDLFARTGGGTICWELPLGWARWKGFLDIDWYVSK